jgi:hypothetical protein
MFFPDRETTIGEKNAALRAGFVPTATRPERLSELLKNYRKN